MKDEGTSPTGGSGMATTAKVALGTTAIAVAGAAIGAFAFAAEAQSVFVKGIAGAGALSALVAAPLLALYWSRSNELDAYRRRLNQTTSIDTLTNCLNGVVFPQMVDVHRQTGGRRGALLMVAADGLGDINDRFGHRWGDDALRIMADSVRASIRSGDLVGRLGGSKFGVFLPGADLEAASRVAERIRKVLGEVVFEPGGTQFGLSVSVGGIVYEEQLRFDDMVRAAHSQLRKARSPSGDGVAMGTLSALPRPEGPRPTLN
jgi:diguanylate cyclase